MTDVRTDRYSFRAGAEEFTILPTKRFHVDTSKSHKFWYIADVCCCYIAAIAESTNANDSAAIGSYRFYHSFDGSAGIDDIFHDEDVSSRDVLFVVATDDEFPGFAEASSPFFLRVENNDSLLLRVHAEHFSPRDLGKMFRNHMGHGNGADCRSDDRSYIIVLEPSGDF